MVNLKRGVLLLFIIFFSSCGDHYITSNLGLRSKQKYKKYLNNRINPESLGINTNVLYIGGTYKNGSVYRFSKDINEVLNVKSFEPLKGDIGFLIKQGNKYFHMYYIITDGGQFVKSEIIMKGDSLTSMSKHNYKEYFGYYEKKEVPKEWLDYEPDY